VSISIRAGIAAFVGRFAVADNGSDALLAGPGLGRDGLGTGEYRNSVGNGIRPQGLPVKGARVTVTNAGTGAQRTSVTDDGGRYNLVGLSPGQYKMSVDGGANFSVMRILPLFLPSAKPHHSICAWTSKACSRRLTVSTEARSH